MNSILESPFVKLSAQIERAEGIPALLQSLGRKEATTIDGVWGSSAAMVCAGLAMKAPSVVVVVLAYNGDLEPWTYDLTTFFGVRPAVLPPLESWPVDPNSLDDTPARRLRTLRALHSGSVKILLTTVSATIQPVPSLESLQTQGRSLKTGDTIDLEELSSWLVREGYKRVDAVELPGEFARRGGIFDVYSPDRTEPIRLEFFGDEIETIRSFSTTTQRSLQPLEQVFLLAGGRRTPDVGKGHLSDHLPPDSWIVFVQSTDILEQGKFYLETVTDTKGLFSPDRSLAHLMNFGTVSLSALPQMSLESIVHFPIESIERFSGNVHRVREELDAVGQNSQVLIACDTDAEIQRLQDVLKAGQLATSNRLQLVQGSVRSGFRWIDTNVVVIGSHELFHREQTPAGQKTVALPRRQVESRALDSFLELTEGDLVVHVIHGIARFRGMRMLERFESHKGMTNTLEENLLLEFRDGNLLYVPASKIDLIQKYVGSSRSVPELSRLGSNSWAKKKEKVAEAVRDLAAEMLQLQAIRAAQTGFAYPPDTEWQKQFEASFPYQETPDQILAIEEVKRDMCLPRSMDRLLCGDVGFGKTEVALRAAFKAADNGKQVAMLVPTTILAEQHFRTFRSRFAEYPFRIECLNRFRSSEETRSVLKGLKSGEVDIVIGTHRLVSKDVQFKDLGLVIIDEEQRFGVVHKERLKQLRATVDILTMTATPIPRTLHLSLLGVRDISNLETPPPERLPVETRIIRWDEKLIRAAILRELGRDGQVYFVHNRVYDIHEVAHRLRVLIPEARVAVGHGQMSSEELEEAMMKFLSREAQILVATTIIESGVDIPNANTIFIDQADQYGLADLHQLRGRVGRQKNRAYAYLIVDEHRQVTADAVKRLKAIEEFTALGSGFKIAMRDLEIRGAGNILGTEQSGHISSVGYEMYCQLLENAVRTLKKMPLNQPLEVNINLPWPAFLPSQYVPGQKLRIEVYRRLSRVRSTIRLDEFAQELLDRYGPIPEPTEWLIKITRLRILAAYWQISSIHRNNDFLVLGYHDLQKARMLCQRNSEMKIVDEKDIYLKIPEPVWKDEILEPFLTKLLARPKNDPEVPEETSDHGITT